MSTGEKATEVCAAATRRTQQKSRKTMNGPEPTVENFYSLGQPYTTDENLDLGEYDDDDDEIIGFANSNHHHKHHHHQGREQRPHHETVYADDNLFNGDDINYDEDNNGLVPGDSMIPDLFVTDEGQLTNDVDHDPEPLHPHHCSIPEEFLQIRDVVRSDESQHCMHQAQSTDPHSRSFTRSSAPLVQSTVMAVPQQVQFYAKLQQQQYLLLQQQHQLSSQQQPMHQLLTSLNQLAAVSTTQQTFQSALQSLGLPHAVLAAAAMSLTHQATSNPSVDSTTFGLLSQQQQLSPYVTLQQLQQSSPCLQQQPYLPQGGGQDRPLNTSHAQIQLKDGNAPNNVETTVSNDTITTPILNNPISRSVNMNKDRSANIDAINDKMTTSVINNQTSSVNAHTDDSKKCDATDSDAHSLALHSIRMNNQTVHTTGQNAPAFKPTSSQPSNFVSPVENEKLNSVHIDSKEENLRNVNTATTTSHRNTITSSPTICTSHNHDTVRLTSEQENKPAGESCTGNHERAENLSISTIILPCRARGMPPNHNFKNAHFIIPPHVTHGEDLVCSHAVCRQGGIKFRYCLECRLPVAKRNFHQRHGHGHDTAKSAQERHMSAKHAIDTHTVGSFHLKEHSVKESSGTDASDRLGQLVDAGGLKKCPSIVGKPTFTASSDKDQAANDEKPSHNIPVRKEDNKDATQRSISSSISSSESSSCHKRDCADTLEARDRLLEDFGTGDISLSIRKGRWATLLDKRPSEDDSDGMSAWLLEVMAVSDSRTPCSSTKLLVDAEDECTESEGASDDQHFSGRKYQEEDLIDVSTKQGENSVSGSRSSTGSDLSDSRSGRRTKGLKRKLPSSIVCV